MKTIAAILFAAMLALTVAGSRTTALAETAAPAQQPAVAVAAARTLPAGPAPAGT